MNLTSLEFDNWTPLEVKEMCISVDAQKVVLIDENWESFNKRFISKIFSPGTIYIVKK